MSLPNPDFALTRRVFLGRSTGGLGGLALTHLLSAQAKAGSPLAARQALPAYVALGDPGGLPVDGPHNWSSGFLPAVYQGTPLRATGAPVANLHPPGGVSAQARRNQLRFLDELNADHLQRNAPNTE